jgi:hypothetical protein
VETLPVRYFGYNQVLILLMPFGVPLKGCFMSCSNGALTPATDPLVVAQQIDQLLVVGETLVASGILPAAIKSSQTAVAVMLMGRELGVPPMAAFSSIDIIDGKPAIKPALMLALAHRTGQLVDRKVTDDGQCATAVVIRAGMAPVVESFSMKDAERLNLASKYNWVQQPKNMRKWRALSAALRLAFADVLSGLYSPEELGAELGDEQSVVVEAVVTDPPMAGHVPVVHEVMPPAPDDSAASDPEPEPDGLPWMKTPEAAGYAEKLRSAFDFIGDIRFAVCLEAVLITSVDELSGVIQAEELLAVLRTEARRAPGEDLPVDPVPDGAEGSAMEPLPENLPQFDPPGGDELFPEEVAASTENLPD